LRYYLSLGSNISPKELYLKSAIQDLGASVLRVSHVYETQPVGGPKDQASFLNMAVEIESELGPYQLLEEVHKIEARHGRERLVYKGPRTLDIDIVYLREYRVSSFELTIPHLLANQRGFVIAPLSELAPDLANILSPDMYMELTRFELQPMKEVLPGVVFVGTLEDIL
jgi:2-amino-4-hydroxy-6-hydroxymethyldihydropteridine diphosphokinase